MLKTRLEAEWLEEGYSSEVPLTLTRKPLGFRFLFGDYKYVSHRTGLYVLRVEAQKALAGSFSFDLTPPACTKSPGP